MSAGKRSSNPINSLVNNNFGKRESISKNQVPLYASVGGILSKFSFAEEPYEKSRVWRNVSRSIPPTAGPPPPFTSSKAASPWRESQLSEPFKIS